MAFLFRAHLFDPVALGDVHSDELDARIRRGDLKEYFVVALSIPDAVVKLNTQVPQYEVYRMSRVNTVSIIV